MNGRDKHMQRGRREADRSKQSRAEQKKREAGEIKVQAPREVLQEAGVQQTHPSAVQSSPQIRSVQRKGEEEHSKLREPQAGKSISGG